jgi:hypothetical protein
MSIRMRGILREEQDSLNSFTARMMGDVRAESTRADSRYLVAVSSPLGPAIRDMMGNAEEFSPIRVALELRFEHGVHCIRLSQMALQAFLATLFRGGTAIISTPMFSGGWSTARPSRGWTT